ncbi:hypothetical protein MTR_4g072855 [Medicago truncatula]|uniref:Uncharacterized protein n=1 Tax=Medicago truncatula TaxID=3880 RepID=A0A072UX89_MEDTR|nr:hypothetical protein MTR_4g072855 [Medicago truncatula]
MAHDFAFNSRSCLSWKKWGIDEDNTTIKRTFRAIHKVLILQAVMTNTAIDFNFRRHNNMQPLDLSFQQTND